MNINDNKLYLYQDNIDVVITTTAMYVDNLPMNQRKLIAHKGLTNEIYITVRDRDRKPQNVYAQTLRAYIINPTTKQRILSKVLENTTELGIVKLILDDGDLVNLQPGLYHAYITRSDSEHQDKPVYSNHNNNIRLNLEITDQTGTTPIETQEETTLLDVTNLDGLNGSDANTFVTGAFRGNLNRNFQNAQHTVAFYPDNFSGQVVVQASCVSSTPQTEYYSGSDWFDVATIDVDEASNSIQYTNFVCNCNWVRLAVLPTTGTIERVLLRN